MIVTVGTDGVLVIVPNDPVYELVFVGPDGGGVGGANASTLGTRSAMVMTTIRIRRRSWLGRTTNNGGATMGSPTDLLCVDRPENRET